MSWTVSWSPECDEDIRAMPYKTAERVCMAVFAFATDGEGKIEIVDPDDDPDAPTFIRIRARGGFALVKLVPEANRIDVWRVRRSTPPKRTVLRLL
jgi:hypothetical protein